MARRVLMEEVSVVRVRGRPRLGQIFGVKMALGIKLMTGEDVSQCEIDINEWRALEHM